MGRSLEPLVGPKMLHFLPVSSAVGAVDRKNRLFGLVEPLSAVFRPYFHVFAVARACTRPSGVFLAVAVDIVRNLTNVSFWVQRQGSGDDPRAIRYTIVAREGDCIATACGSYPAAPCCAESISSERSPVTLRGL